MEKLEIQLDVFEGPLDLLLYLIKKNKMDIYDIRISIITDQYVRYLNKMKKLNMEIATEFLVMASTLMYIKSKMLLPIEKVSEDEIDVEDPKKQLIEKLAKYKVYKEVAKKLSGYEDDMKHVYKRDTSKEVENYTQRNYFFDFSFYEMLKAYKKVMDKQNNQSFHEVIKDDFTVEDKIQYFKKYFKNCESVAMSKIVREIGSKIELVVCFLAILELVRIKVLRVKQNRNFGEIWIYKNIKQ